MKSSGIVKTAVGAAEPVRGLYNPEEFRDNCGFGMIAHQQGVASHKLLQTAIESLTCMTHRGGIAADGKTGDGCGLLLQMPTAFMRSCASLLLGRELKTTFAVGMVFMSRELAAQDQVRKAVDKAAQEFDFTVATWRVVPTQPDICGEIALAQLPQIEQVFLETDNASHEEVAARLFMVRRRVEIAMAGDADFYICSLSDRVISYKGLVMPADLEYFYPDLGDDALETAICVFHQRFSTNTLPKWPLAQPFRMLAYNGEINTIEGNRNWSKARTPKLQSKLLPDLHSVTPSVNESGSDSSSLDNMLEMLVTGGVD